MQSLSDRYATVGRRDFQAAIELLLETEFKLVGGHRVIRLFAESMGRKNPERRRRPELRISAIDG